MLGHTVKGRDALCSRERREDIEALEVAERV
jgi:hypothetical protein